VSHGTFSDRIEFQEEMFTSDSFFLTTTLANSNNNPDNNPDNNNSSDFLPDWHGCGQDRAWRHSLDDENGGVVGHVRQSSRRRVEQSSVNGTTKGKRHDQTS